VILPVPAITETAYFVSRNLVTTGLARFLKSLSRMRIILESPIFFDYHRAAQIIRKYNGARIDFVDDIIVAVVERLNITRILTVDRRHFSMFRPAPCNSFEILP
jgi:uncharacterized protein